MASPVPKRADGRCADSVGTSLRLSTNTPGGAPNDQLWSRRSEIVGTTTLSWHLAPYARLSHHTFLSITLRTEWCAGLEGDPVLVFGLPQPGRFGPAAEVYGKTHRSRLASMTASPMSRGLSSPRLSSNDFLLEPLS